MVARAPLRAVVVGAGAGGLASAMVLAARGWSVTLVESADVPGGKLRAAVVGGRMIDAGPTVLTMPWVFERLFNLTGARFDDYVALEQVDIIARHAWPDGSRLDLRRDPAETVDAVREFAGADEADRYRRLVDDTRHLYDTFEKPFIRGQLPTYGDLVLHAADVGLGAFTRVEAHRSMWDWLKTRLRDPRLVQLFARYATYVGASPFEAPATLCLIAHVEALGVHRVRGGMGALASALFRRLVELGAEIRFSARVSSIVVERGACRGVVLAGGERVQADAVVFNGDVAALAAGDLGPQASVGARSAKPAHRSLSAVTWAVVAKPVGFPLVHHNVFFSNDYEREFEELLGERRVPTEPTVYVCAEDRSDDRALAEDERLLIIVNAPATGDEPARWESVERERCERATLSVLHRSGLTLQCEESVRETPMEWAARFPATGGALYGERPRSALSAMRKSPARSKTRGLYLAGGSVHPGPGVPMATQSGMLAADAITKDFPSTASSPRAATRGITSTG